MEKIREELESIIKDYLPLSEKYCAKPISIAVASWVEKREKEISEQLRLCNIDQFNAEARIKQLESEIKDRTDTEASLTMQSSEDGDRIKELEKEVSFWKSEVEELLNK